MLPFVTDEEFLQRWQLWRATIGLNDPNSMVQQAQGVCWGIQEVAQQSNGMASSTQESIT